MAEVADPFKLIIRLGEARRGVYVKPPADEAALRKLEIDSKRELGEQVPAEYVEMLRLSNGFQINCAYFMSAEDIVPLNLDVLYEEIIRLGNAGSLADFVFDKRDRRFHTINLGFPDERFSSYDTFKEMLAAVMKEQQVLEE